MQSSIVNSTINFHKFKTDVLSWLDNTNTLYVPAYL